LSAHAFGGLVYRQVVDLINGVRDAAATRELIVRENMRYAKRQLTWFKKEPNVQWIEADGGAAAAESAAVALVQPFLSGNPRSRVRLEA
jgi:tRNA dimethylallyltransferase